MRATFADWRDRLTFIVSESPVLAGFLLLAVLGVVVGLGWLFTAGGWDLPSWAWSLLGGYLVLLPALAPSAYLLARWLRRRRMVTVYLCNAEAHATNSGKAQEKYYVPPDVWARKSIGKYAPTPINGGSAWQVREYDWDEDTRTLFVEGTPLPEVNDDRMFTWKTYVEDIYSDLIAKHHALNRARDRMSKMAVDVEQASVNENAEARERGLMMDKNAAKDAWSDATSDLDDLSEMEDLPNVDDYIDAPGDDRGDDGGETDE
ncbi:hypothetical protein [Halocalculus aciditolerans]|uniref:Uncharacterized protein n=1 Tax=Halocalculus aciditolerans TaxID=1383812 RepID=A0A830F8H7_9EURY|nr:hypothetical protein [Halocalculus aciditolerans]GGL73715.1 hypothetical protein GCM10009039_34780 [Halocalculus aciditolerans]